MRRDQLEHAIRTACHAGELSPFEELHGFSIDGVDYAQDVPEDIINPA